ncbi:MAG: cupin domain-containing protein [Thiothrix sp.]|nr:cupin domain-containing protein [Thiothrix sp.]
MQALGSLEDLPQSYVNSLTELNLVPLWPSLRAVLPPEKPQPQTRPIRWRYHDIRPLLLQAGELTPIEKAERRVLVLANPGHGLEKMQASSCIYLGMQLLLPNEVAPPHRHTPNAVRMVVEGEDAYTTVNGEKCPMVKGDLILTPTGLWHEHRHDGDQPVIWLDVLDLPLVYYMEASFVEEGRDQDVTGLAREQLYHRGIVPTPLFQRSDASYPILRYPWADARSALLQQAEVQPQGTAVQVSYVNPETGGYCQNILGFSAMMVRAGESVRLPKRSPAQVFHLIEGAVQVGIDNDRFELGESDTCCAPCFAAVSFKNSGSKPAFVFIADEAPIHQKLGLYSERA